MCCASATIKLQSKNLGDPATSAPNPHGNSGDTDFSNVEVNFKYQQTPAVLAGAAFDYMKGCDVGSATGVNTCAKYYHGALVLIIFCQKGRTST
ncbi:hypothetical protein PTKU64_55040 [Paraburkholderia terrae]|uniref:Porin n=1 Tax=Paraburkholderia terrae TaxID=311230 RepID=A0ABM7TRQ9_9BURK|nr:hypothetical protein PTKU64_55040 [Paraburkholderia terrae]